MNAIARPWWVAVMAACVVAEFAWRRRSRRGYDARGALVSLAIGAGHLACGVATAGLLGGAATWLSGLRPPRFPIDSAWSWVAGFFAVELAYYAFHRCSHRVRWMWATHAVHHTPEELTFLSAVRLGWTTLLSGAWLFMLPLVALGFDARLVFALLAFNLHYQFFLHTEAFGSWGVLERVLNTPSHHRVHHASNAGCIDRNFGGVLIVFDRLFGTFARAPADEPLRYGLATRLPSSGPLGIVFGEWRRLASDVRASGGLGPALKIAAGRP